MAGTWAGGREREHGDLQGHASNDLKASHVAPPITGSTTSQQHHAGDQPFHIWILKCGHAVTK